jgi:hypothetical protein
VSDTQITAVSPTESAGRVSIVVVTPGGVSTGVSADEFSFDDAPTVSAVSPAAGPTAGGRQVVISGTNFRSASAVNFGGTPAVSFTVVSPTSIVAQTPGGPAATVAVTVTTPGGTSTTSPADAYTFQNVPVITSISPSAGPTGGGTSVTITGTGLTGTTRVWFGTTQATSFTNVSDTQITAVSPTESAGRVSIVVVTPGGVSTGVSADEFSFS